MVYFADALGDEYHFFGVAGAFVVPFGHVVAQGYVVEAFERVLGGCVGVYHGFNQRV